MLTQFVVGSIPVISDERVKGYIQESIRLQINGTREQRIISTYYFIISAQISGTTRTESIVLLSSNNRTLKVLKIC